MLEIIRKNIITLINEIILNKLDITTKKERKENNYICTYIVSFQVHLYLHILV